jgi:hypothetical protein
MTGFRARDAVEVERAMMRSDDGPETNDELEDVDEFGGGWGGSQPTDSPVED